MKPLTQAETDQLLILLRKLWHENSNADQQCKRHAKGLFSRITTLQVDNPASAMDGVSASVHMANNFGHHVINQDNPIKIHCMNCDYFD